MVNMTDTENKIQLLDFIVLFICVFTGCLAGRYVMNHISNSILGFNGPAIGVLVIGELVWLKVRGILQKRWSRQEGQGKAA